MSNAIKLWSALGGVLLFFILPAQATIHWVTKLGVNSYKLDVEDEGTFTHRLQQMADGDTLKFGDALAGDTLYLWQNPFNDNPHKDHTFTIIGNGITMKYKNDAEGNIPLTSTALSELVVENMRFIGGVKVAKCVKTHFKNCIFRNEDVSDRSVSVVNNTIFEGCAFLATGGGDKLLRIKTLNSNVSTHFISCTFYSNANLPNTNYGDVGRIISLPGYHSVTLTNCVLIDDATDNTTYYAILVANSGLVSKGYNVIHGLVDNTNAEWKQATDAYFSPDTAVNILTFDEATGKYLVHVGTIDEQGPAYRRLPPNPNNLLPDVVFPRYDLDSTLIDYSKPTHSGAWQAIDGTDLEIAEAATGIIISSGQATNITDTAIFSEGTLQLNASVEPNNTSQAVRWESSSPLIAAIDETTGLITTPVATYDEPQTVTITCTTTEAKNETNGFLTVTVTLTVRPYVHVSSVALPDSLDLTVGHTGGLRAAIEPANANNPAIVWSVIGEREDKLRRTALADSISLKGVDTATVRVIATAVDGSLADTCIVTVRHADYRDGVFFVNEDWTFHNPSTINFLHSDGHWSYRIFQAANPDNGEGQPYTLGVTAQYGTVYGDNIYITQKQPGTAHAFGANARTMQLTQYYDGTPQWTGRQTLPLSDGRAYIQLNDSIGYESTSNGIIKYDYVSRTYSSLGMSTSTDLYSGQAGTMRRVGDNVFVVQQGVGIRVINARSHRLFRTLTDYNYATLTQSFDGYLWAATTAQVHSGTIEEPTTHNVLVRIDPWTLDQEEILLPEGVPGPPASWGAWQFDAVWASTKENVLYWAVGSKKIVRYDIDADAVETVFDIAEERGLSGRGANSTGGWAMYGTSFGIHPKTDELYVSTSLFNLSAPDEERAVWEVLKVSPHGEGIIEKYPLVDHYWFIAMPVFPDNDPPEFVEGAPLPPEITLRGYSDTLKLGDKVTDPDNMDASIVIEVADGYDKSLINPQIWRDSLIIEPSKTLAAGEPADSTTITLNFNSNGRVITHDIKVILKPEIQLGIPSVDRETISVYPNPFGDYIVIESAVNEKAVIRDISGRTVLTAGLKCGSNRIAVSALSQGVYILYAGKNAIKIVK